MKVVDSQDHLKMGTRLAAFLPRVHMHEGIKQFVLSVCQFVSLVKKVTYVYLIGSKAVLYPLLFQQFPI